MVRIEQVARPTEADRHVVALPLSAFNDAQLRGQKTADEPLALHIHDEAGEVSGGVWGRSYYEWLFIELLVVPEGLRGRGLGTSLLARAEDVARGRGCRGVWLDTFSFQARGFYEKHGYVVFGRIDDYPAPHCRFFLSKRWAPVSPACD